MKRFLLFGSRTYYPRFGFEDFIFDADDYEYIVSFMESLSLKDYAEDNYIIVDTEVREQRIYSKKYDKKNVYWDFSDWEEF